MGGDVCLTGAELAPCCHRQDGEKRAQTDCDLAEGCYNEPGSLFAPEQAALLSQMPPRCN